MNAGADAASIFSFFSSSLDSYLYHRYSMPSLLIVSCVLHHHDTTGQLALRCRYQSPGHVRYWMAQSAGAYLDRLLCSVLAVLHTESQDQHTNMSCPIRTIGPSMKPDNEEGNQRYLLRSRRLPFYQRI